MNTVIFFAVIQLVGSSLLGFFGISLPIMQVSGGIVIAMIGWSLLNQKDSAPAQDKTDAAAAAVPALLRLTKDSDESVRDAAALAVWTIDPKAAAKANVPRPPGVPPPPEK